MTETPKPRPPLTLEALWFITRETVREWNEDRVPRLGAALAFYSVMSLGPLLLIVVAVAGVMFSHETVSTYLLAEIRSLVGERGARAVQGILAHGHSHDTGMVATFIGIATLVISSTGFFAQLQDALNAIWNVDTSTSTHWTMFIRKRILSFTMILGIGLLLLIGLVISAALSGVSAAAASTLPGFVMNIINLVVSYLVITLLFGMIYKFLPDVEIKWRDVAIGAAMTAFLFETGKFLIGLYLGRSAFGSAYGAAGSLIVLLVWIYYSTQIFFLGAEFTQVYARYMGAQIKLKKGRGREIATVIKNPKHPDPVKVGEVVNVAKTPDHARPAEPKL